jgi:phosphoglucomutase
MALPGKAQVLSDDGNGLTSACFEKALGGMILSASGWRGVFASSGNDEGREEEISSSHMVITALAARAFSSYLKNTEANPVVLIGMDTRPTGPAIAGVMIRAFLADGCGVCFAGVTAAPEIMAYARYCGTGQGSGDRKVRGFVYISASHNPVGHNGIKFGLVDGGVLPGGESAKLIAVFKGLAAENGSEADTVKLINSADPAAVDEVYKNQRKVKENCRNAYLHFTREVVSGKAEGKEQDEIFSILKKGIKENPLGVAADFNGSARTLTIDKEFLNSIGIPINALNDQPGEIAHRIVPEGESLEPCRRLLEETHVWDPSFSLGYVPDCDGDRGNLVVWDDAQIKARILEAQEVFALACVSELAYMVWTGSLRYDNKGNALDKAAIAVNDPTSLRIDRIARAFDVSVFRAEVGEANVVNLARKLRDRGYAVRILGEGPAGGNITHPAAVRDPINTVMALVKLLVLRSAGSKPGLFELWCNLSDQAETYHADYTLKDIIASLPCFITTGAYTEDAVLRIKTQDHAALKDRYEKIFRRDWDRRKEGLKQRYGIVSWEAAGYMGTEEKRSLSGFGSTLRGGLKITFYRENNINTACIWMRGSGTEPVFRIMADAEGPGKRLERELIEWQREMVIEADNAG